ncbi:Protein of unknown function [Pyronema omphalodes CBS 100304]|uniref:Uncharacterized protein n=1 Tax=Pyronema omphalodes (strain CBS 100304) TaxID=1076935 RepID=U4LM30_PYROM|nr:Protein of unknown function [Pyronema omphalodes CBS 100304]
MTPAIMTAAPATLALPHDNFIPAFGTEDALALEVAVGVAAEAFSVPDVGVEVGAPVPVKYTAPSSLVNVAVARTLASVGHWSAEKDFLIGS